MSDTVITEPLCPCHGKPMGWRKPSGQWPGRWRCRVKSLEATKRWQEKYPERRVKSSRESNWKRNGIQITHEEFEVRLEAQDGRCAICRTDSPGSKGWQVDHCHDSNKVRGILCGSCNRGLGLLGDNVEALRRAIEYLQVTDVRQF